MIRVLVDGVFFQINNTGIARVWRSILNYLREDRRLKLYFLDRGNSPIFEGVEYIEFPEYSGFSGPQDSVNIQKVCDKFNIDVFTSTYYTTPLKTPMLLVVYDMIPELFDFNLDERPWMEKQAAISFSSKYVCISKSTEHDLLTIYPEIPPESSSVAYCGVDENVFFPRTYSEIEAFKNLHGLTRDYFLFVGSRVQYNGYKNSDLFFKALNEIRNANFDVFCVGGEENIEPEILDNLPKDVSCKRVSLTDDELALAYGGAIALVYPSLYEGFGMPVIEAMASGCPVITTRHGSLAEAAGNAALLIGGGSVEEMKTALIAIQNLDLQESLRQKGFLHASKFRWVNMAKEVAEGLFGLYVESQENTMQKSTHFYHEWERLRKIQASVDDV